MKIIIKKKEVIKSFMNVQGIVEKSGVVPILSNILLEAKDERINLYATNLKVSLIDECPAIVERDGSVALDAKKIFEIIKEAPEEEIFLEKNENNWVKIKCGKIVYSLAGSNPLEYPEKIKVKEKDPSIVKAKKIIEMIRKTIFATAEDESRGSIGGVLWETSGGKEGKIRMVATDAHRLSYIERKEEEGERIKGELNNIIIPKKGMLELKRLLEDFNGQTIRLWVEGGSLLIKKENTVLIIRLIEGEFPDYKKVISFQGINKIKIKTPRFLDALRRVSIILEERMPTIKIIFLPGTIAVMARGGETGEAREEIEVDYKGSEQELYLNLRYIWDSLNSLESENFFLETGGPKEPVKILSEKDDDYISIIMPMVF
jgi:DNA polymerase-3 subunit beta